MSHHYCGPHLGFPHGDARLDITDLFAFSKTVREARVLVETVVEDSIVEFRYDRPSMQGCRAIRDRLESLKPSLEDLSPTAFGC